MAALTSRKILAQALAGGHTGLLTPRSPFYFDYPQDKTYLTQSAGNFFNTSEVVYRGPEIPAHIPTRAACRKFWASKACIWTGNVLPPWLYLEFMTTAPLGGAGRKMAWTPDSRRDFAQFNARLKPFLQQYQRLGIHYYDETNAVGSLHGRPAAGQGRCRQVIAITALNGKVHKHALDGLFSVI